MGSGTSKAGEASKSKKLISPLEGFKENARQFNDAIQAAGKEKAAIVGFTDIMGRTVRRWFNGAVYSDRKPSEQNIGGTGKYKRKGTYKAEFKPPKSWGKNFDFG